MVKMKGSLVKRVLIMGVGMATGQYDLFVINLALLLLKQLYPLKPWELSALASAATLGTMSGQIIFGFLGDILGRKNTGIITCALLIVGAAGSGLSFNVGSSTMGFCVVLSLWRLVVGMGVGGEYPVTAIFTSESASRSKSSDSLPNLSRSHVSLAIEENEKESEEGKEKGEKADGITLSLHVEAVEQHEKSKPQEVDRREREENSGKGRGMAIAAMFSSQGVGQLAAAVLMLILVILLPEPWAWRMSLIAGAIPPLIVFYPRLQLTENAPVAAVGESVSRPDPWATLVFYKKQLLGTAGTWFLFDIVFYGNGLFAATLIDIAGVAGEAEGSSVVCEGDTERGRFKRESIAMLALPGYWAAVLLVDSLGRKTLCFCGFVAMSSLYIFIGMTFDSLKTMPAFFIFLYGLTYFFANIGPNPMTFILPTETYPASVRSTCHGLSAASGKLGAVLGAALFTPLLDVIGVNGTLIVCGLIGIVGAALTLYAVEETMGRDMAALELQAQFLCKNATGRSPSTTSLTSIQKCEEGENCAPFSSSAESLDSQELHRGAGQVGDMLMKQQSGTKRDFSGENEHDDITIALEISDDEEEEIEASLDLN